MNLVYQISTLVVKDTTERVYMQVFDDAGDPVDATSLSLKIFDISESAIIWDDITDGYGETPALPSQIVKPADTTGLYYFPFGDTSFDDANTTDSATEYVFRWSVIGETGSEPRTVTQIVKVVSLTTLRFVSKFRLVIDKIRLAVDEDPNDPLWLGYTDYMLVQFLEDGLSWINAFQPYPMWESIDAFPEAHVRILWDAATCAALTSQELLAVATDINYSDSGNVLTIEHQPKLSAILNTTWTRLKETVPGMKRHYIQSGALHIQIGPNYRLQAMLNASPSGRLFRNGFIGGPQ